jgi:hypothetical protein
MPPWQNSALAVHLVVGQLDSSAGDIMSTTPRPGQFPHLFADPGIIVIFSAGNLLWFQVTNRPFPEQSTIWAMIHSIKRGFADEVKLIQLILLGALALRLQKWRPAVYD